MRRNELLQLQETVRELVELSSLGSASFDSNKDADEQIKRTVQPYFNHYVAQAYKLADIIKKYAPEYEMPEPYWWYQKTK